MVAFSRGARRDTLSSLCDPLAQLYCKSNSHRLKGLYLLAHVLNISYIKDIGRSTAPTDTPAAPGILTRSIIMTTIFHISIDNGVISFDHATAPRVANEYHAPNAKQYFERRVG